MIAAHQTMLAPQGAPLPYDAEVEYLEDVRSLGNKHGFDTGLYVGKYDRITARFSLPSDGLGAVFGAMPGPGVWKPSFALVFSSPTSCSYRWSGRASTGYATITTLANNVVDAVCDNNCVIDGTTVKTYSSTVADFTVNGPLVLMNRSDVSSSVASDGYPLKGRLYRLTVVDTQTGTVRGDYIPVRKGGLGYFYDKVSGVLIPDYPTQTGVSSSHIGPDK